MKYFSLFSGIGGFELGIQQAYENLDNRGTASPSELAIHGDLSDSDASNGDGRGSNSNNNSINESNRNRGNTEEPSVDGGIATNITLNERFGKSPTCVGFSEIDKYAI